MESTIRIERYADQGRCVGHIDGRVVFVRFALPGELVRVVLDEPHDREDRFWTGEVTEVLEASEDRVEPVWPLAGPLAMGGGVGGADLAHVSLPGQLKWKSMSIAEQMRRLGHVDVDVPIERMPEDEAEQGLHWRTRIEMIADENGRPSMRRRGTHVRVPIDTMPLASRALLNVAEKEHVWDGGFTPGSQIRLSVPEPRGNAEIADNYAVLVDGEVTAGNRELTEKVTVCGREFEYGVDAGGFWQMHRHAPIALTGHVMSLVHGELDGAASACLWDLYSGSGLFTLPLATLSAGRTRMLSVEGGKTAVKHAQRNLRAIHLGNVDARVGDVAKTLANVRNDLAKPDIVVLDPPRAGARAIGMQARSPNPARARRIHRRPGIAGTRHHIGLARIRSCRYSRIRHLSDHPPCRNGGAIQESHAMTGFARRATAGLLCSRLRHLHAGRLHAEQCRGGRYAVRRRCGRPQHEGPQQS